MRRGEPVDDPAIAKLQLAIVLPMIREQKGLGQTDGGRGQGERLRCGPRHQRGDPGKLRGIAGAAPGQLRFVRHHPGEVRHRPGEAGADVVRRGAQADRQHAVGLGVQARHAQQVRQHQQRRVVGIERHQAVRRLAHPVLVAGTRRAVGERRQDPGGLATRAGLRQQVRQMEPGGHVVRILLYGAR